jgi:5'-nucleotidase
MAADPAFIFGVDLDGVCGDYGAALQEVVAADLGVTPEALGPQVSWEFGEWGLDRAAFDRLHRSAVLEHRILRTMPPIAGAAEALWRLSDAGVWIRVITHRLCVNWGHAVAVADTVEWLDGTGIPYRDLCFLGNKPQVEADAYVDDAPHNIESLRDAGNIAIVFDQPYNRHVGGLRAVGWEEVEQLVIGLVAASGVPLQAQFPGIDEPSLRLRHRLGTDTQGRSRVLDQ